MIDGKNVLIIRQDVTLENLSMEFAPNMYRWMCDPIVSSNLGLREKPSLAKTQTWISKALQDPSILAFAVFQNGQHVGNVILDRIDIFLASARLSVYIGEHSARQVSGVGRTGLYLALNKAFLTHKLHKVWLTVHSLNYPAISVYRRLGFRLEGILRDEFWLDGYRTDVLYLGLLEEEYRHLTVTFRSKNIISSSVDD
jgi:RimJ/RimL family protein N-acetyltransferase